MAQLKDTIKNVVNKLTKPEIPIIEGAERLKQVQEAAKEEAKKIEAEKEK